MQTLWKRRQVSTTVFFVFAVVSHRGSHNCAGLEKANLPPNLDLFKYDESAALTLQDWGLPKSTLDEPRRALGGLGMSTRLIQVEEDDPRAEKTGLGFLAGEIIEAVENSLSFCERSAGEAASQRRAHAQKVFFSSG